MKFSKEDHLLLINLVLEVLTIPDLDFSLVQKFAQLLTSLLKYATVSSLSLSHLLNPQVYLIFLSLSGSISNRSLQVA